MNLLTQAARTGAGVSEPIGPASAAAFFVNVSALEPGASLEVTLEGIKAGAWETIARSPRFSIPTGNGNTAPAPFVIECGPGLGLPYANERIATLAHPQVRVAYSVTGGEATFSVDAKVIPQ